MKKTALYVGRFQPFHNGHLSVVKEILEKNEKIIIAIGSAEKNFLPNNPLNAGERVQMIDETLKAEGIDPGRFLTIPIRNINNYALWVNHINVYVPNYDRIYTGSNIVKGCYEGEYSQNHRVNVKGPEIIQLNREKVPISATEVREAILVDGHWDQLVPKTVAKYIKEWHIIDRLKNIRDTMDLSKYNNSY
jgi:nicotinamide-nucleotide adenylyltransferase